ncbi:MAG: hypothetical protein K8R90_11390 [Candidatus Cloacimonetes bacterium]|nr:hypothetical protein [Candidatus Cloacimonadota bacterium]
MREPTTLTRFSLLLLAALMLASCNIFDPREAEDPAETADWNPFPVSPQMALDNLRFAWMFNQNGAKYGEILTPDFVFSCDQQDVIEYGVLSEWDAGTEESVLLQVFVSSYMGGNQVDLTLVEGIDDVFEGDEATVVRDYQLDIFWGEIESPMVYEGRLAIEMFRGSDGLWRLASWQDSRKDNESTSWGRMKDAYRP